MAKFLIDVNLPERFSIWNGDDYLHVLSINDQMTDREIWNLARERNLTIVSKDADFSHMAMLSEPPPRVVHICLGNMKMKDFHRHVQKEWPWIVETIHQFRLVRVFRDRIEAIT